MTEHIFIKKRQQQRRKSGTLLTTRNALRLIVVSILTLAGFLYFIGDPTTAICESGCESKHSLASWTLGFFMIFATIIAFASGIGAIFGFLRWQRSRNGQSFSALVEEDDTP